MLESPDHDVRRRLGPRRQFAILLHGVEPLDHLVQADQTIADQLRCNGFGAGPDRGQHVLRRVQGPAHGVEIDDAGGAFEGVKSAEGAVEPLCVVRIALKRQEVVGSLIDQLAGFYQELFDELVQGAAPQSRAAYSTSVS